MDKKRVMILNIAILTGFLTTFFALVIIMLMPQKYWGYRGIAFPLAAVTIILIRSLKSETIDLKEHLSKIGDKEGYPFISVLYGSFLQKKYKKITIWLSIFTLTVFLLSSFVDLFKDNVLICLFPLWLVLLLLMRSKLINERIAAGVFGTNAQEAKELISFMLSNYENIDFTDGDGNIKKGFLPENLIPEKCEANEIDGVICT